MHDLLVNLGLLVALLAVAISVYPLLKKHERRSHHSKRDRHPGSGNGSADSRLTGSPAE